MSANTMNKSNMSNMPNNDVVHKETSSNSNINISISTKSKSNNDWKKYQRIKPEVTIEFPTFYHFLTFNMSLGHNGFRTRPGIDKFRFTKNQVWFPKKIQDKISLGKELAQAMMTIPAIKERFYVRGIFNNAGTPENMSDMDMFEIHVMDLKPNPNIIPTTVSSLDKEVLIAGQYTGVNITDTKILAPKANTNSSNFRPSPNHHVANKTIAKKSSTKKANTKKVAFIESDFPPLK